MIAQRKSLKNSINAGNKNSQLSPTAPSRLSTKSPFSNSKCSHQSKEQTVSYGELQIVLENLQNIKQKASNQVKQLNQQNLALKQEINELRTTIEGMNTKLRTKIEDFARGQEQWQNKYQEMVQIVNIKNRQLQEKQSVINELNKRCRDWQAELDKEQSITAKLREELVKASQKWSWAFNILAGDEDMAEDIVWKIKHENCNIWQIIEKQASLTNMLQLSKQKVDSLTQQLSRVRQQYRHAAQMLDKSLTQRKEAGSSFKQLEKRLKEQVDLTFSLRQEKHKMEQDLKLVQTSNDHKEALIISLQHRIEELTQEEAIRRQNQIERDRRADYNNFLGQICDQTEDYEKVLQRLQYLQKFQQQHYRNVEKIQFLVRQFDG